MSKWLGVIQEIDRLYGGKIIELDYETPFQLLSAVILSAQTTDKQVNKITPPFFARIREARDIVDIPLEEIESYLKYVNFFRNKSRFIKETGTILARDYDGIIPNSLEEMQKFPGVGVKTAKVVLSVLYGMPYVGVDTHIHRVANRLGMVSTLHPNETDKALDMLLSTKEKEVMHHPFVLFGRYHCRARNPKCSDCTLKKKCAYYRTHFTV